MQSQLDMEDSSGRKRVCGLMAEISDADKNKVVTAMQSRQAQ